MQDTYVANYENLEKNHWWWRVRRSIIWNEIKHRAGTSQRLLEIGCGAGTNLTMAQPSFDCTGVEPDSQLRECAARNTGMAILDGALPNDLPQFANTFNVVLLLDVLEHVEQDCEALVTIRSLLSESGMLVINVPAFPCLWSVHDEVNQHYRRYRLATLAKVIEDAGLHLDKIRYWGSFLFPIAYMQRKLFVGRKGEANDYQVALPGNLVNRAMETASWADSRLSPFQKLFGLSVLAIATRAS